MEPPLPERGTSEDGWGHVRTEQAAIGTPCCEVEQRAGLESSSGKGSGLDLRI